jgi:hypothetical protein
MARSSLPRIEAELSDRDLSSQRPYLLDKQSLGLLIHSQILHASSEMSLPSASLGRSALNEVRNDDRLTYLCGLCPCHWFRPELNYLTIQCY